MKRPEGPTRAELLAALTTEESVSA
jgi:hypothetical protein